jgi:hypothetical protein
MIFKKKKEVHMEKRRLAVVLLGLLAVLVIPFSIARAQQDGNLPPAQPVPLPDPFLAREGADNSPAQVLICPEVIYAAAAGGGTWVSRLQVTAVETGTQVRAAFFYGSTATGYYTLFTSSGSYQSSTYSNILSTLGTLAGVSLYGRVGTLVLATQGSSNHIIADVETLNGNYGKSFPAVQWIDNASFNYSTRHYGLIEDISNTAAWRTGVGCWNGSSYTITVRFYVLTSAWVYIGSSFVKTLTAWQFVSFNPFTEAGLTGSYDGYRLLIDVQSTTAPSPYSLGLFVYGSKANNYTNDSMALFARPLF